MTASIKREKYVVMEGDEATSYFGNTPEEAVSEYMSDEAWEHTMTEPPTEVEVAECRWQKPSDFTRNFGAHICDWLGDELASQGISEYCEDISQGLEHPDTAKELDSLIEPVLTAWFTKLCEGQGGMNIFFCGEVVKVPTGVKPEPWCVCTLWSHDDSLSGYDWDKVLSVHNSREEAKQARAKAAAEHLYDIDKEGTWMWCIGVGIAPNPAPGYAAGPRDEDKVWAEYVPDEFIEYKDAQAEKEGQS